MKKMNPTCWDCGEKISWDEATATEQRLNGKVITVYVCPECVREALAAFRNPKTGPSKVCYYCGARIYTPYKLVKCPKCGRPWRQVNPIRHTKEGWFWGSRGPFRTREKAGQVARAAYAGGYRGRNPMIVPITAATVTMQKKREKEKKKKAAEFRWNPRSGYRKNPKGYGRTLRGAVMRLAGRYRKQGMSHDEALSRAWQSKGQIREYMIANPDKWRSKTNWLFIALIAGGIGYWIWKSRKKETV